MQAAKSRWKDALKKYALGFMTVIALVSIIGNILLYNHFNTHRPLVSVGKTVITKRQYLDTLEDAAGKQVLNKMVFAELVRQAATQAGVMPTNQEVAARIAYERAKKPSLYADIRDDQMRADVTALLALENLRIKNVTVTDGDISYYYLMHGAEFRRAERTKAALVVTNSLADAKAAGHMLGDNIPPAVIADQTGFQLVGMNGYTLNMQTPERKNIVRAILKMKRGKVSIFRMGKQFLTVEVYTNPASVPPLWQVKDRVSRLAKLAKAPTAQAVLASLYHANKPKFEIDKYAAYFVAIDQFRPAPPKLVPPKP